MQPTKTTRQRLPLRRTTRWAMGAVIITMVMTSPVLTALSIGLLPEHIKATESERFISELGLIAGGYGIKLAVVLTASSLLLFAANTAIIGSYHVFLALVKGGFLPQIMAVRNPTFTRRMSLSQSPRSCPPWLFFLAMVRCKS
jgi:Cu/Ag efflux pump CusA